MNGMADDATRWASVIGVGRAMRCWRSQGATGLSML